jgi:hypothetical protein
MRGIVVAGHRSRRLARDGRWVEEDLHTLRPYGELPARSFRGDPDKYHSVVDFVANLYLTGPDDMLVIEDTQEADFRGVNRLRAYFLGSGAFLDCFAQGGRHGLYAGIQYPEGVGDERVNRLIAFLDVTFPA